MLYIIHFQRFYISTSRQLKRLESAARSPIYSHFQVSSLFIAKRKEASDVERIWKTFLTSLPKLFWLPVIVTNFMIIEIVKWLLLKQYWSIGSFLDWRHRDKVVIMMKRKKMWSVKIQHVFDWRANLSLAGIRFYFSSFKFIVVNFRNRFKDLPRSEHIDV